MIRVTARVVNGEVKILAAVVKGSAKKIVTALRAINDATKDVAERDQFCHSAFVRFEYSSWAGVFVSFPETQKV